MALTPGTRLGVYEVTAKIGEGGMGEVYQAHDTTLDRDVALKVLPEAFTADPDRLARFQREAKVLASLNHPNIGAIYGLEATGDTQALVLELIEGPTLADRIAKGPIPVDEALTIATQIADALEAAHEQGIVHRDLKPANVKVRPDGTVKVLDFGLAKAVTPEASGASGSESPTMSLTAATQMGMVIGTAAYMAPEQAKGKPVDKRADIWAFGVILLEMLSGKRLFTGETASETLAAVMMKEPDWDRLPADLPMHLSALVRSCLEKDQRERLRDIGDVRLVMKGAFGLSEERLSERSGTLLFASRPAQLLIVVLGLATVALGAFGWLGQPSSSAVGLTRASISLPPGHALSAGPEITRDGQRVAFVSSDGNTQPQIYTRQLDEPELSVLDGTEEAQQIFFSPDGRWIAFYARGGFFKVRVDAGEPVRLADASTSEGGYWHDDGTIFFTPSWNSGLYRIDEGGGEPEPFLIPDRTSSYAFTWPSVLPGGREMLFSRWGSAQAVMRLDLTDMTESVVVPGQWRRSRYVSSGHIVFAGDGGDILALPNDQVAASTLTPEPVLENVDGGGIDGYARMSVSENGTLVYSPLDLSKSSLVVVDQLGGVEPVDAASGTYEQLSLSPDGRRVAIMSNFKLFIHDLDRGSRIPLVPELPQDGEQQRAVWSVDGTRVVFASNHEGSWNLYSKAASGAGEVEAVFQGRLDLYPTAAMADGTIFYEENNDTTGADLWYLPLGGTPEPWLTTSAEERQARPSPSERTMAYVTDVSGRDEISVQPIDRSSDPVLVSTAGGTSPVWSPSGDRLYFRSGHRIMVTEVSTEPVLQATVPSVVFEGGWELSDLTVYRERWDVLPDDRFLMVYHEPEAVPTRINVIFNWFEELKQRVPVP